MFIWFNKGKNCIEKFCKDLKEHAIRIINYEKKEMIPLTDEENKSYESKKYVTYTKKSLVLMITSKLHLIKSIKKEENIVITQGNLEVLLMIFTV